MSARRRRFAAGLALLAACAAAGIWRTPQPLVAAPAKPSPPAGAFGLDQVDAIARQLATVAYKETGDDVPEALRKLPQESYRKITFRGDADFWRGQKLPFGLEFFHPGWRFDRHVELDEIAGRAPRTIAFDAHRFDFGTSGVDATAEGDVGYAGWRATFALNSATHKDEVLSFIGASYFRALSRKQTYGLSARGLAIDTAVSSGEEFPRFTHFWIERPAANGGQLTAYALLDSPRATGAYAFVLQPGTDTTIEVTAHLYLRAKVSKLGIAPLTSMFYFGSNQPSPQADYRPEVHDSDGLSIESASGEWLWRPLLNPKRLLVTAFDLDNPRGFGLLQRNRLFTRYEDLDVHYEQHPSAWIEPLGDWGKGRVELVEIPSPDETNDNIVAYWIPAVQPAPQQRLDLHYRIHWPTDAPHAGAFVAQTRLGSGFTPPNDGSIGFVLDFVGPQFAALGAKDTPTPIVSTAGNGTLVATDVRRNPETGGWRVSLRLRRDDAAKPVEMRAALRSVDKESETWSYILPPD